MSRKIHCEERERASEPINIIEAHLLRVGRGKWQRAEVALTLGDVFEIVEGVV